VCHGKELYGRRSYGSMVSLLPGQWYSQLDVPCTAGLGMSHTELTINLGCSIRL